MKSIKLSTSISGKAKPAPLLTILALLVIAGAVCFVWAKSQLEPANPGSRSKELVKIPAGSSAESIAALLADRGLIRSRYSVLIEARLLSDASRLKPGVYELSAGQTPEEIVGMLADGRTSLVRVTFPEGFTLKQFAARLALHHLVDPDQFEEIARNDGRSFHTADGFTPPTDNLEGFLFPDTYYIEPGTPAHEIIQSMVERFDTDVVQIHPEVSSWLRPVILGSLIEREAEIPEDRPIIAAVLYNRLKIDMPLQIDATVQYALPEHKARLLYKDLKTPSPYNTYLRHGLPPGAICNPGLPSINAALNPAKADYLFYVQGTGRAHIFSRTLAEQDRNIALVRRMKSSYSPS